MSNLQQDREALEKEREKAAEAYALLQWARKHQELSCLANINLIKSYLNGDEITEETLEESTLILLSKNRLAILPNDRIEENAAQQAQAVAAQSAKDRIDLEAALLAELDGGTREHVRRTLKWKTNEEIRNQLDELRTRRALSQMSVEDLHKFIKAGTKLPEPQAETVTLTKAEILALDPRAYRALLFDRRGVEKPGVRDQINRIMRGN
jgi:hypothetical protein